MLLVPNIALYNTRLIHTYFVVITGLVQDYCSNL